MLPLRPRLSRQGADRTNSPVTTTRSASRAAKCATASRIASTTLTKTRPKLATPPPPPSLPPSRLLFGRARSVVFARLTPSQNSVILLESVPPPSLVENRVSRSRIKNVFEVSEFDSRPTCRSDDQGPRTCDDGTTYACFCDGVRECPRGEDEAECGASGCRQDQFSCDDDTQCIESSQVCDGVQDCFDNADEDPAKCFVTPARPTCRSDDQGPRTCDDGTTYACFCDGVRECPRGEDEAECGASGKYVPHSPPLLSPPPVFCVFPPLIPSFSLPSSAHLPFSVYSRPLFLPLASPPQPTSRFLSIPPLIPSFSLPSSAHLPFSVYSRPLFLPLASPPQPTSRFLSIPAPYSFPSPSSAPPVFCLFPPLIPSFSLPSSAHLPSPPQPHLPFSVYSRPLFLPLASPPQPTSRFLSISRPLFPFSLPPQPTSVFCLSRPLFLPLASPPQPTSRFLSIPAPLFLPLPPLLSPPPVFCLFPPLIPSFSLPSSAHLPFSVYSRPLFLPLASLPQLTSRYLSIPGPYSFL
ncbi:hypothetical protein C7M84_024882 [Penaeus vannamei]|uniref:Uncharacterized protein n=1 Tax=Penaeus vannamei TaxID=6689 RepID=A0A3R7NAP1_PENVA|nr:hypothetical protein C7M84_024882 [Penaeus vannamei]